MTRITGAHQAARLYKAIVKDGWAAELELVGAEIDPDAMLYLAHIHDDKGEVVETHELEMTQDAADVWLAGGI